MAFPSPPFTFKSKIGTSEVPVNHANNNIQGSLPPVLERSIAGIEGRFPYYIQREVEMRESGVLQDAQDLKDWNYYLAQHLNKRGELSSFEYRRGDSWLAQLEMQGVNTSYGEPGNIEIYNHAMRTITMDRLMNPHIVGMNSFEKFRFLMNPATDYLQDLGTKNPEIVVREPAARANFLLEQRFDSLLQTTPKGSSGGYFNYMPADHLDSEFTMRHIAQSIEDLINDDLQLSDRTNGGFKFEVASFNARVVPINPIISECYLIVDGRPLFFSALAVKEIANWQFPGATGMNIGDEERYGNIRGAMIAVVSRNEKIAVRWDQLTSLPTMISVNVAYQENGKNLRRPKMTIDCLWVTDVSNVLINTKERSFRWVVSMNDRTNNESLWRNLGDLNHCRTWTDSISSQSDFRKSIVPVLIHTENTVGAVPSSIFLGERAIGALQFKENWTEVDDYKISALSGGRRRNKEDYENPALRTSIVPPVANHNQGRFRKLLEKVTPITRSVINISESAASGHSEFIDRLEVEDLVKKEAANNGLLSRYLSLVAESHNTLPEEVLLNFHGLEVRERKDDTDDVKSVVDDPYDD